MLRRLSLLILALIAPVHAADVPPKVSLTHLTGGVYLVEDPFHFPENGAVYVGPDSVTVIGATWTPDTARQLVDEIRKITSKPIREVVNPDFHLDRTGGNSYFRSIGADIVSTRMTYDALQSRWNQDVLARQKADPSYPTVPLALPSRTYPGDFELQDGQVRAFYLGPSHTLDGIFIWFPAERVLYAGCILKEHLGALNDADLTEYPKTLQKLKGLDLPIDRIIAGHWSPVHGPELIDRYLDLLASAAR